VDTSLRVLLADESTSADHLDEMTRQLRRELLQLDVHDVAPQQGGQAPPGARGLGIEETGALLVTLNQSVTALSAVIDVIRGWRARSRERPTIRLVIDGDVLEISEASHEQVAQSFDLFVDRHSGGGEQR
jgi:hypothetical protein